MRTSCLRFLFVFAIFFLCTMAARADSLTFTLIPLSGDVSDVAGSTVGWGFVITNTSASDYLDINGIDSDLFLSANGTPDASIFLPPDLPPGGSVMQPYDTSDPTNVLGLFQFTWNADVPVGTTETGNFTLYGAFCGASDPFCGDDGDVPVTALATAAYSATVISSTPVGVAEPSLFLLLLTGLCAIGLLRGGSVSRRQLDRA